jgi:hypothetical protein
MSKAFHERLTFVYSRIPPSAGDTCQEDGGSFTLMTWITKVGLMMEMPKIFLQLAITDVLPVQLSARYSTARYESDTERFMLPLSELLWTA